MAPMPVYTSDALILRTYKLGEADRIVVFLTRDRGKKRGVAKGARRAKSRFTGALESLTRAGVAYYERELRDLVRINYIEPQRSPLAIVARARRGRVRARPRGVLRRADRRVGARRARRRAAVPARVLGHRRASPTARRPSGWRATSSSGCCGCRASTRSCPRARVRRPVRRRRDDAGARAALRLPALRRRRRHVDLAGCAALPAQRGRREPGGARDDPARRRAPGRELETAHRRLIHLHLEKELKSARVLRQMR